MRPAELGVGGARCVEACVCARAGGEKNYFACKKAGPATKQKINV